MLPIGGRHVKASKDLHQLQYSLRLGQSIYTLHFTLYTLYFTLYTRMQIEKSLVK